MDRDLDDVHERFCVWCGRKITRNAYRQLCRGHLALARDIELEIELRVSDMPVDLDTEHPEREPRAWARRGD